MPCVRRAEVGGQDTERVHSCRTAFRRMVGPLARYRQRGGFAPLSTTPRRSGDLTDHTQRHDHGSEVFLRSHAQSPGVDGENAPCARGPDSTGDSHSRGGGAPDRVGSNPQAPHRVVGGVRGGSARSWSARCAAAPAYGYAVMCASSVAKCSSSWRIISVRPRDKVAWSCLASSASQRLCILVTSS